MARHEVQVLRAAGKTLKQVAAAAEVSQRSVQRIELERPLETVADLLQARPRGVGRPSVAAPWRDRVAAVLAVEPALPTMEILHQLREERRSATARSKLGCFSAPHEISMCTVPSFSAGTSLDPLGLGARVCCSAVPADACLTPACLSRCRSVRTARDHRRNETPAGGGRRGHVRFCYRTPATATRARLS